VCELLGELYNALGQPAAAAEYRAGLPPAGETQE
jgi:hypothetical protein